MSEGGLDQADILPGGYDGRQSAAPKKRSCVDGKLRNQPEQTHGISLKKFRTKMEVSSDASKTFRAVRDGQNVKRAEVFLDVSSAHSESPRPNFFDSQKKRTVSSQEPFDSLSFRTFGSSADRIASPDDASVGTAIFERISSHNQRTRKSANVPSQIVSESILDEVDYQVRAWVLRIKKYDGPQRRALMKRLDDYLYSFEMGRDLHGCPASVVVMGTSVSEETMSPVQQAGVRTAAEPSISVRVEEMEVEDSTASQSVVIKRVSKSSDVGKRPGTAAPSAKPGRERIPLMSQRSSDPKTRCDDKQSTHSKMDEGIDSYFSRS